MSVPKCEFMLHMIGNIENDKDRISGNKLNTIIYLLEKNVLNKLYNKTMEYNFENFSLAGPYDKQLMNDLKAWRTLQFIKNIDTSTSYPFSNIRLNEKEGGVYKSKVIKDELATIFGGYKELDNIEGKFKEYLKKSDKDLFDEAYNLWLVDHQDKKNTLETLFNKNYSTAPLPIH